MGNALESRQTVWVEFMPVGSTHKHLVFFQGPLTGDMLEDMATDLADSVAECSEDRHRDPKGKPHGQTHDAADVGAAARAAISQMYAMDYDADWADFYRKVYLFKKWGRRQVPAAVLTPDPHDPYKWWVIMPHPVTGEATIYPASPNASDILPPPEWGKNAYRDPSGVGWIVKRRLSAQTRLKRLFDKGG